MRTLSRRQVLGYGLAATAVASLPLSISSEPALAFAGGKLAKFAQRLPVPGNGIVVARPTAANTYTFHQREISRQLHPHLPPTPVWAYDDGSGLAGQAGSFGLAVLATTGTPVTAHFINGLPATYPSWIPVDPRLSPFGNQIRLLTHLHGGFIAGESDGNPAVTPHGFGRGEAQTVHYANQGPQNAARLLWFHDHGLGTTRLNVFAGLAAAYLIRDEFDTGEERNPIGLPGGAYEIPLVIQDRQFNADGTFRYPTSTIAGVTWIGEYFGDTMLVNGKVWPYLDVEPRLYRFRVLNGCNARILNLGLGGTKTWQIGNEGGLFDVPVPVRNVILAPAERADLVVDFSRSSGQTLVVKNSAPPSPISTPAPPLTAVMQIRVGTRVSQAGPGTVPTTLPGQVPNLPEPRATRFITLNEVAPETADWMLNLNGARFGEATQRPRLGTVEDWVYVNLTADTHPMHTHLFTHQVIGRTPFDVDGYVERFGGPDGVPGGHDPRPFATGSMQPPGPDERGFKDTTRANPGYFTTIRAQFELPVGVTGPQTYVHHCHIVEHEDNDMMESFTVS
jgi:spore coat protein A